MIWFPRLWMQSETWTVSSKDPSAPNDNAPSSALVSQAPPCQANQRAHGAVQAGRSLQQLQKLLFDILLQPAKWSDHTRTDNSTADLTTSILICPEFLPRGIGIFDLTRCESTPARHFHLKAHTRRAQPCCSTASAARRFAHAPWHVYSTKHKTRP